MNSSNKSWVSQFAGAEPKTRKVYDGTGVSFLLKESDRIGRGKEAAVYAVPGIDGIAVKLWHKEVLEDATIGETRKRLADMLAMEGMKSVDNVAWPRDLVYDVHGEVIGYVMKRMRGSNSLYSLFYGDAGVIAAFSKCANRLFLAKTAREYVRSILELQDRGVSLSDFNPKNVLLSEVNGEPRVEFLDADSMQFFDPYGKVHHSSAHVKAYLAPELFEPGTLDLPRTNSSTEFAAALVAFAILTMGGSPYTYVDAADGSVMGSVEDNLRKGLCGLGGNNDAAKLPPHLFAQVHEMTYGLKALFIKWFKEGHHNLAARPQLRELANELDKFIYVLGKDPSRLPLVPKSVEKRQWVKNMPKARSYYGPKPFVKSGFRPRPPYVRGSHRGSHNQFPQY